MTTRMNEPKSAAEAVQQASMHIECIQGALMALALPMYAGRQKEITDDMERRASAAYLLLDFALTGIAYPSMKDVLEDANKERDPMRLAVLE